MAKTSKEKPISVVGANMPRNDVIEKVTGSAVYTDDIQFGNKLLHARAVRSPHPHALIKRIDTSKAEKLPGVKAVVSGKDFPERTGLYLKDKTIFATDRVRFVGEPVAAVAAVSVEIAQKACELIEVEYELLEPVLDAEFGASDKAPLIHPDMGNYECVNFIFPKPGTNISNHFKIRRGDCAAAWKECEHIVERTYRIPHIQHVPIETHVAIAQMDDKGKITVWASSQSPLRPA
jgi:CO/xanthine dehydrogenase Mo-binding subunit